MVLIGFSITKKIYLLNSCFSLFAKNIDKKLLERGVFLLHKKNKAYCHNKHSEDDSVSRQLFTSIFFCSWY